MATENVPVFNKYDGNGAATEFSIGFPYLDTNFIKVYIKRIGEEEEKLDDSRFSFVNDTTIKFPVLETDTVLQEGEVITIQRETSLGSEYEFDNQVRLFPEEVMNADDLAFQQIQELARDLERAVKVKPTDEKTSDELIDEVYISLKTATETADKAIDAANQAQQAADNATEAAAQAQAQIDMAVANAISDVKKEAVDATNEIIDQAANTVTQIAKSDVDIYVTDTITPLVSNAEADASNAAESAELAANEADESKHWAEDSRVWATGEDAEIEEIAPNQYEHSSRGYADLAMAIANTPEDVPVDASTLLALEVIKGPKGDAGEADFSGDVTFTGTFDVHSDSNHPVKITGMAGTSATGYQIVDSNGLGDSDFEHYATGDRYGTRITNHNNTSDTSVSIDFYQSNVGKSVLDLTDIDTVFVPTPSATDNTQRPANTEWVNNAMSNVSYKSADETITGRKTFSNENNLEEVEQTVIYAKAEGIEQGNTPTDTIYTSLIKAIDKLGKRLGVLEISQNTDGSISNSLGATNSNGEHASITVHIKEDGTKEAVVSATPSNSANGNHIATTAWVKNILKTSGNGLATISKAQSGYCQFTNGLIINWGYVSEAGTDTTITFKKAFSSASSYSVVPTMASGTAYGYPSYVKSKTASNFVIRRNDSNKPAHFYIAIGY